MAKDEDDIQDHFIGKVYAQMIKRKHEQLNLREGLRRLGENGKAAVKKEIKSFQDFDVLVPLFERELTEREKWEALPLMMTVKEKRDGTIKGRAMAGGHLDRGKIPADEAISPTASTEGFYLTCAMDAFERRFVALLDVPSAYFHAKAGRVKGFIMLEGILVDLFLQVEPSAAKKVTRDKKGRKVLYTRMNKALYGHIMSGRLFWEHLSLTLTNFGFAPNPDDLCILNKEINRCWCTVVLHVDDIKLSHVEERVVREVASQLEVTYGPMEIRCDEILHYCGLTLDYSEDGCVKIGVTSSKRCTISQKMWGSRGRLQRRNTFSK